MLRTVLTLLLLTAQPSLAQSTNPTDRIVALGDEAGLLTQIDTLARLSEELVFWMSVSIMGADRGWQFDYNAAGTFTQPYTYRLYNILDEAPIEAARAAAAIARSRAATEEDRADLADLYEAYQTLHARGAAIHALLLEGQTDAAAAIFEGEVIALRRAIANAAYSRAAFIRDRISDTVMDARLNR